MNNKNNQPNAQPRKPIRDQNIRLKLKNILAENTSLKKRIAKYKTELNESNSTAFQESHVITNLENRVNELNGYLRHATQQK